MVANLNFMWYCSVFRLEGLGISQKKTTTVYISIQTSKTNLKSFETMKFT